MSQPNAKVLIATPMGYKKIRGADWFTGDTWISAVLQQDYPEFRVFVLAHNLTDDMTKAFYMKAYQGATRNGGDRAIELVSRGVDTDTPVDDRSIRKELFPNYDLFAQLRNVLLAYALQPENLESEQVSDIKRFDYLVQIDSDVIVHPDAVSRLVAIMEANPDVGICGLPVNNFRRVDFDMKYPDAGWNFGKYRKRGETLEDTTYIRTGGAHHGKFKLNTILDVDYVGAASIIRVSMLEDHPQVRYSPCEHCEDFSLCYRAKEQAGFKIKVDTSQVTLHMMDPAIYRQDFEMFNARRIV